MSEVTRQIIRPDARSPYQRYGKTPFRYSSIFYSWDGEDDPQEKERKGRAHSQWYGLRATKCEMGEVDW